MAEHQNGGTAANVEAMYAATKMAEEKAMEAALAAEVTITLEKKAGSEVFRRNIQATSASAAVNGVAVLIREVAALLDMPVVKVLAVLATVLTAPAILEERKGE